MLTIKSLELLIDVGNTIGMIQSDPNFNKSSLRLKSNSSVQIDLDADLNGSGPNSFVVNNGTEELFNLSKQNGAFIENFSPSISKPHLSIMDNSSTGFARINLGNNSGFKWQIAGRPNGTPALSFYLTDINGANGGSDKMLLYGTGDLLILGTLTQNSDLTLKTNVSPIVGALENIVSLNGYNYYWKDSFRSKELQTGVIAQEVMQVFPELVQADKDGLLSVNYSGLIPYLVESIKELKAEIDILKTNK